MFGLFDNWRNQNETKDETTDECEFVIHELIVSVVSDNPVDVGVGYNVVGMFGVIVSVEVDEWIKVVIIESGEELVELW